MLNRLRRIWELSKKDLTKIDDLSIEDIKKLPDKGDGKAVFMSEGNEEEYEDYLKEQSGIKAWYDRLKNL